MALRPYQERGLLEVKNHYASGTRKVLLKLATGGGKTVVFSELLKQVDAKGNDCIMVVRGRQLVEQASQRLFRENVNHGVLMAGHWNRNANARVQICSIDTLTSRGYFPPAKLVVIDEAHLFTSPTCRDFIAHYSDAFILAVTATPYIRESLRHVGDVVVSPITVKELIDQGYLVNARYFSPSLPDLKGVKTMNGDYSATELEARMSTLTGDVVNHWRELGENRPTVCFAVNVSHSQQIVAQFNDAGIPAEHIEGTNTFAERAAAIERLKRGEIKILSNVGVLCIGVDIPFLSCIIMARPTKSYNLFIQQAGRGTRPYEGKSDFIILDHAGNTLRHGFITEDREVDLDGKKKEDMGPTAKLCKRCYLIYEGAFCQVCGPEAKPEKSSLLLDSAEGVLEELKEFPMAAEITQFVNKCKETRARRGYHHRWVFHKVKEKYGDDVAYALFPKYRKESNGGFIPGFLRSAYEVDQ